MYVLIITTSIVTYIEHFNGQSFDWLTWRSGSILQIFKIPHRTYAITANADLIRKYAIGWCDATKIPCRPKIGYIAVMFNTGELYNWWTHLTIKEFEICFPELKEYTENIKN